jgi:HPr Serine kinase C-terminal domain
MTDSYLCGWRVRSDLRLPELAPWSGDDREPDVVIRFGEVPDRLDDLVDDDSFLQVDRRGTCLLRIENIADYLVTPREIVVSPRPGAVDAEIRVFLLGSVFGFLCHQRGLFPLHASCVAIGGKAAALCGQSGAGKSTTALCLTLRGHRLIADDVCVIDVNGTGVPRVLPAFPRLKLWQDTLAALDIDRQGLEWDRLGEQEKYHYLHSEAFSTSPIPLGGIFLLRKAELGAAEEAVRVSRPAEKIAALSEEVFRARAGIILGRTQSLLAAQAAIAGSTPIWRISRRFDLADRDRWLRQIETLVGA